MNPDWIDRAFLERPGVDCAAAHDAPVAEAGLPRPESDDLLERLLAAAPAEWESLAEAVARSALEGRRVVAVTGGRPGEGRSTVARGVAVTLRRRGTPAEVVDRPPFLHGAAAAGGPGVVVVDPGPWFTPGPVRRAAVARAALGCDAAIVVRAADAPPCPAWLETLAGLGIPVVAEAVTFASDS